MKGYIHVYTGDGKGKTTAALGLAVRALGAGMRVFLARFMKTRKGGELAAFEKLGEGLDVGSYGRGGFITGRSSEDDRREAVRGLRETREKVMSGEYDVVILDEVNVALYFGLLPLVEVLEIMDSKPDGVELVLTGRNAPPEIIEHADLVTEMRKVKHYYDRGVTARPGIEI